MSSPIDSRPWARARAPRRPSPTRSTRPVGTLQLPARLAQAERGAREATAATYHALAAGQPAPTLAVGTLYRSLAGLVGPRKAYDFVMRLLLSEHEAAQARLALWAESMRVNAKLDREAQQRAQQTLTAANASHTRRLGRAADALRGRAQAALSLRAQRASELLRAQALRVVVGSSHPASAQPDRIEALTLHVPTAVPLHWAVPRPPPPEDLR